MSNLSNGHLFIDFVFGVISQREDLVYFSYTYAPDPWVQVTGHHYVSKLLLLLCKLKTIRKDFCLKYIRLIFGLV